MCLVDGVVEDVECGVGECVYGDVLFGGEC